MSDEWMVRPRGPDGEKAFWAIQERILAAATYEPAPIRPLLTPGDDPVIFLQAAQMLDDMGQISIGKPKTGEETFSLPHRRPTRAEMEGKPEPTPDGEPADRQSILQKARRARSRRRDTP